MDKNTYEFGWLLARQCEMFALVAEIEGMKAANAQRPNDQPYEAKEFMRLGQQIWQVQNLIEERLRS